MINYHIQGITQQIAELRSKLLKHEVYQQLDSMENLHTFMQFHVFAVWDFMVLLKALQKRLTSVEEAWQPTENAEARKLINEIVLAEESDVDPQGNAASHYELYIAAMKQAGADVRPVIRFMDYLKRGYSHKSLVKHNVAEIPEATRQFLLSSYQLVRKGQAHEIAASFTFGREDLIPDLFTEIVRDLDQKFPHKLDAFIYYLNRHIELDGDEHGPMAHQMIASLCGNDDQKWLEAENAAHEALQARLHLWDSISKSFAKSATV